MPKSRQVIPLGNRLVIEPRPEMRGEKKDLERVGEIYIPDSAATGKVGIEPYYLATVLAAGPECVTVKKGDTIIAVRNLDWKVTIDGVVLACMIRENECHGCVK